MFSAVTFQVEELQGHRKLLQSVSRGRPDAAKWVIIADGSVIPPYCSTRLTRTRELAHCAHEVRPLLCVCGEIRQLMAVRGPFCRLLLLKRQPDIAYRLQLGLLLSARQLGSRGVPPVLLLRWELQVLLHQRGYFLLCSR